MKTQSLQGMWIFEKYLRIFKDNYFHENKVIWGPLKSLEKESHWDLSLGCGCLETIPEHRTDCLLKLTKNYGFEVFTMIIELNCIWHLRIHFPDIIFTASL